MVDFGLGVEHVDACLPVVAACTHAHVALAPAPHLLVAQTVYEAVARFRFWVDGHLCTLDQHVYTSCSVLAAPSARQLSAWVHQGGGRYVSAQELVLYWYWIVPIQLSL